MKSIKKIKVKGLKSVKVKTEETKKDFAYDPIDEHIDFFNEYFKHCE
jgi:hypothetical protein